ncbi:MAG: hypothetical protein JSS02_23100 [Planctomycetes bacterium]|nr:hypothetical protein [Planctomycetota bacterium]
MTQIVYLPRHQGTRAGMLLCALLWAGCGQRTYQSKPVDDDQAQEVLTHVLDTWKQGASIDSLQNESPKIVVQDLDWSAGVTLVSYELVGEPEPKDANLVARVKLSLRDKSGADLEKTVTYVVGTSPTLTVVRDLLK